MRARSGTDPSSPGIRLPRLDPWYIVVGLVGLVVLSPLLYILAQLLSPAGEGWDHVVEHLLPRYTWNTVLFVIQTAGWALLFGVVPAWLVSAFSFPGRRVLSWLLAAPLAVPTYIAAFAWAGLLDFTGPVTTYIRDAYGLEAARQVPDIMTVWGASFVCGSVLYPYVYITARLGIQQQSGALVEAARTLGASPWRVFVTVVLPALRPALAAGLGLVVMETLNDYGAVHYYGVDTLTTGIFRAWLGLGDADAAVRLSAVLLLGVVVALVLERLGRRGARYDDGGSRRPLTPTRLSLPAGVAAMLVCLVPVLVGLLIPVGMLGWWASFTAEKVVDSTFWSLAGRSVSVALTSSLIIVTCGVLLAYAARIRSHPAVRLAVGFAGTGYAVPGAVIAVGVFVLGAGLDERLMAWQGGDPQAAWLLVGSAVALVWAYLVRFLAVGLQPIDAGFARQGARLDDAARTCGVSPLSALRRVHLPLLRGTLLGAATLAFVDVLKELPLTLILRPFDFETLATHTYQLASEELVPESAPSALVLIAFGLVAVALALRATRVEEGR